MYHIVMLKRKKHFAIADKPQFQMSEYRINGVLSRVASGGQVSNEPIRNYRLYRCI